MRRRTFILCLWTLLITALAFAPAGAQQSPLATCSIQQVQEAFGALAPYAPGGTSWIGIQDGHFVTNGAIFYPQGINYYPQHSPWRRFLTETDLNQVEQEMGLLSEAGLNVIRVYLWNDALFSCPGSGAVPVPAAFQRLDGIVQSAARHNMHVIMTLNDMPDLQTYPLYSNPPHVQSQTAFIVSRYRSEPAVMAWDMRNAGDIDYGSENNWQGAFSKETVLAWLGQTYNLIRSADPNHLITAGWGKDSEATIPYVDFVSFAYWNADMNGLRDRLATLRGATPKPLVLSSFGFSTFEHSEDEQAQLISSTVQAAEDYDAAGWLLWTAFDFPLDATCVQPNCPSADSREHHFGLWRWDLTPKPAVQAVSVG